MPAYGSISNIKSLSNLSLSSSSHEDIYRYLLLIIEL